MKINAFSAFSFLEKNKQQMSGLCSDLRFDLIILCCRISKALSLNLDFIFTLLIKIQTFTFKMAIYVNLRPLL